MAVAVGLLSPDWNINKSKYDEIDSLPLMATPVTVVAILISYWILILFVGPNFMKNRKPFKLNNVLLLYNALQVIFSAYLVQRYFNHLLKTDFLQMECHIENENFRPEILTHIWLYFIAKTTELLDTVFFVLRKKDNQVTFLHIYHHSIMMIGTWAYLKYGPTENVVFLGFFNSLVHVFMYSYYGLSALGPSVAKYLTWKKYLTTFQLIQFGSMIVQYSLSIKYSECPPSNKVALFIVLNMFFFIYLFGDFYIQSYKNSRNKGKLKSNDEKVK